MCGIVGYVGSKQAQDVVVGGLRRLEYRGYDSAGIALVTDGTLAWVKRAGKLSNLDKELAEHPMPQARTGIGHTRWATHGPPNDRNAHPHLDGSGRIAVVHNGIIENFAALRAGLEARGHEMQSDTDTEVVSHLLGEEILRQDGDLAAAMRIVCDSLQGAFTLVVVDAQQPALVVAARRSSPLVVGRGDGENFVASDVSAFIEHTRNAIELGQDQVVSITPTDIVVTDFHGEPAQTTAYHVDWDAAAAEKGGYD
nr:glutamine--fructose-6-phosphate aminotransferase [Nocardioidaceae bacterium]